MVFLSGPDPEFIQMSHVIGPQPRIFVHMVQELELFTIHMSSVQLSTNKIRSDYFQSHGEINHLTFDS